MPVRKGVGPEAEPGRILAVLNTRGSSGGTFPRKDGNDNGSLQIGQCYCGYGLYENVLYIAGSIKGTPLVRCEIALFSYSGNTRGTHINYSASQIDGWNTAGDLVT